MDLTAKIKQQLGELLFANMAMSHELEATRAQLRAVTEAPKAAEAAAAAEQAGKQKKKAT